jgi:DNA-binding CsgD family transcriptional regulator
VTAESGEVVRSAEWHRIRQFAVGIRGHPAALVIAGEAGAGKSVLWRAGVTAAAGAGHRVLRSEPSAVETDLPFAGLSDLLTEVLPKVADGIPGPQREALEVALLLRPAGAEPPTAHAIGLAALAALRALAEAGPLLVAIDDVHWLDRASLDALTFAFRRADRGPAGLLLTARTGAPADLLTAPAPAPSCGWHELAGAVPAETIELAPLDYRQVRRLLPDTVSAARARDITRQSCGNPFWAREIAGSLESAGTPVPPLARSLTDRLARSLSEEAGQVLAVVAACGRATVHNTMMVLDHLDDPGAALDEAVLAGVVTETAGRLAAAHPLIGAAAVESLPPVSRQRLYARLAEVAVSPEPKARFAVAAAGPKPDPAVAAALDAAAEAAHARAGNAEAARFAMQAVQFTPEEDDRAQTRRRIRAAELLSQAGDPHQSLEQAAAIDLGQLATPDLEQLLPLLLDMTDLVHGVAAANALVTSLARETSQDPRRRALILMLVSDLHYGVSEGRREAATEAIRSAEAAGSAADASLHQALLNLAGAKVIAGDGLDLGLLDQAERLEARMRLHRLQDSADLVRGLWSRCTEDLDTAREALSRSIGRAREAGDDFHLAAFLAYLADTEELAGHYAAAREALTTADTVSAWHDWPALPWYTEPRCELLIADGDLEGALDLASQHLPDAPGDPADSRFLGALVRGRVTSWQRDPAAALFWFEQAAAAASECGFADPGVRHGLDTGLAEAYLTGGRSADARRIAAWLRKTGERLNRPALTGCACRIDAQASAQDGELEEAAELAQRAVAAHQKSPLRPELARSLLVLGQVERRRKARRQSRDALTRARDLARAMGHQPLLALIDQELPRVTAAQADGELTATERRVAELIAAGATNRDAAAALFVSVRTIETHAGSVYRKLGVRNRTELARRFPPDPTTVTP